jgi:hypothetical protein
MIRSAEIAMFSGVQKQFFLRKTADSVGEVRTILFVELPLFFASPAVPRTAAWRQMTDKAQMPKPKWQTKSK